MNSSRTNRTNRSPSASAQRLTLPVTHSRKQMTANALSAAVGGSAALANASLQAHVAKHGLAHLILKDPPWSYGRNPEAANSTHNMSPQWHYPVMSNTDLLDFNFGEAAAKDAVCAIWAPPSQVALAIQMMEKQGFKYTTAVVWEKVFPSGLQAACVSPGATRPCHELLLLGRRGRGLPIALGVQRISGVIQAIRAAHSQKPKLFHAELGRVYPLTRDGRKTKKLELFARKSAPGWDVWGNQAPAAAVVEPAIGVAA